MSGAIDFIAHHSLQAQAAQSVFHALQARRECRWRLGADQAADGGAGAAVLLDHRAFHPRLRKARDGYRHLFHMSHDLGDVEVYRAEPMEEFDLVLVPGPRHREAAVAALGDARRVVEVGWPKFDPAPPDAAHADALAKLESLPHEVTVLYAPTWANTWEWRELLPWLAALPCNLAVKNHSLVDPGQPFPPGEEARYAECRRSIDAMEAAVRALGSQAHIVLPARLNLCTLFPRLDVLVTDSSSCALEFVPFGASVETGRTGGGRDPLHDRDPHASRLCAAVEHMDFEALRRRFSPPGTFLAWARARRAGGSGIVANFRPGRIGADAASVILSHLERHPEGIDGPGTLQRLANRARRALGRLSG
jgi:hypothetical protein